LALAGLAGGLRSGKRIDWDATAMKAKNAPEAEPLIRKTYRKGFELRHSRASASAASGPHKKTK